MDSADRSVARSLIFIGILFSLLVIHVIQWNEYSIEILPLKLKQYLGMAHKQDFLRISEICKLRKKPVCVELHLTDALAKDPKDTILLLELARFRMERKQYKDVVRLLAQYLKLGGKEADARFVLAQALFYSGDRKSAKEQLNYLLFSSKEVPHPDVARFYVQVLIQNREWQTAQKVILYYRQARKNASMFLEKEFKRIQQNTRG